MKKLMANPSLGDYQIGWEFIWIPHCEIMRTRTKKKKAQVKSIWIKKEALIPMFEKYQESKLPARKSQGCERNHFIIVGNCRSETTTEITLSYLLIWSLFLKAHQQCAVSSNYLYFFNLYNSMYQHFYLSFHVMKTCDMSSLKFL